jgi:hypothetical protein
MVGTVNFNELDILTVSNLLLCHFVMPSLRPARRAPLSRVWQRSKESRGNGEEGRSYRNRKRHFSFDTVERTHARAYPRLSRDFSFCFVFCVCLFVGQPATNFNFVFSCTVCVYCFYRPATGEIIPLFVRPAGNWPRVEYSA